MRKTDKIYAYPAHGKEMIQCASKPKSKELEIKEDEDYKLPNNSNYITKRKSIKFDFRIPKRKKQNEFELKFLEVKNSIDKIYFYDKTKSGEDSRFETKESVFTTKLLTPKLCTAIINASKSIAKSRIKKYKLLSSSVCDHEVIDRDGWNTARHCHAATTDLELDLLEKSFPIIYDRTMMELNRLKRKLAKDILKIDPNRIKFEEIFVVKYDAENTGRQDRLLQHRDGSVMTFNILLSNPNEFEGGGTNLCDPYDVDVHLKQGMCLSHYGFLAHSGRRITSGKRFILVAFMQVQDMYLRYSNGSNPFLRTVHEMGCCTIC